MNKTAIVYDWIDKWGGVERLLLEIHRMLPDADFFTSYIDRKGAPWADKIKITPSFIQKLPGFIRKNRILSLPFYPLAFESMDFSRYDTVISVSSSFAKSVITGPDTRHICILLSPTRYFWLYPEYYLGNSVASVLARPYLKYIKEWDLAAAARPDELITISDAVRSRCLEYYGRDSKVIYPPFDTGYWKKIKEKISGDTVRGVKWQNYFLVVSRLVPYKKVALAVELFNKNKMKLIIVGRGSEEAKLRKSAGENIVFLSDLTDFDLAQLYSGARALIMPQDEDFGYVSLEAQFFGCPVISYRNSGTAETIIEGKTGIFFDRQDRASLKSALERFEAISYNLRTNVGLYSKTNSQKFSVENFTGQLKAIL